jgi:hypothetical protein
MRLFMTTVLGRSEFEGCGDQYGPVPMADFSDSMGEVRDSSGKTYRVEMLRSQEAKAALPPGIGFDYRVRTEDDETSGQLHEDFR